MSELKESDWRKYKTLREIVLQRRCSKIHEKVIAISSSDVGTAHGRYKELYGFIELQERLLMSLISSPSRDSVRNDLVGWKSGETIDSEEFAVFSKELRQEVEDIQKNIVDEEVEQIYAMEDWHMRNQPLK